METKLSLDFKAKLKAHCLQILVEKIETVQAAIAISQDSSNSEEKSTAGDKHDTARAMNQSQVEMNLKQISELKQQLAITQTIDLQEHAEIKVGSIALLGEQLYFIAVGLGIIIFQDLKIAVVSPIAPIANLLLGKNQGDLVQFQGNKLELKFII